MLLRRALKVVVGCWLGLLCGASCVAQETYRGGEADGGAGGTGGAKPGSAGAAGLVLVEPEAGSDAGGSGTAGTASIPEPECRTSQQCAPPYPYCSASGHCVECLSQRNCSGTGRIYCDPISNGCVACLQDLHCTHTAPYCATAIGQCVTCISSDNCGAEDLVCDRDNYRCVPACRSNSDCASAAATPFCDPERNVCVECLADGACPAAAPRCTPETHRCVGCLEDADCAAPTPRCDARQQACVQCVSNSDCSGSAVCAAGVCAEPK